MTNKEFKKLLAKYAKPGIIKQRKIRDYEAVKKWKLKNPEKETAHRKIFVEKRAGRLEQKACKYCGKLKVHAHHPDYSKPLFVIWVCAKHHALIHKSGQNVE
jgi:hypothetical protein